MLQILGIAGGGAAGALLRYYTSTGVHLIAGRSFPYGTFTVNVLGCLIMGLTYVLFIERFSISGEWRSLIQVGVLGAFTTFSTFSIETLLLLEQGEVGKAVLNVLASVSVCLMATWLGMMLGRQL